MSEAVNIYLELVKKHGMPAHPQLMQLGKDWYLMPEGLDQDPNDPVSTAVFRIPPADELASILARYASEWAASFVSPDDEDEAPSDDAVTRLKQVRHEASRRKR
ncbi:MAG: hypothetical protein KF696_13735 [Planctomycetes bacterium]|nr:hypothetical protein [Planctomycetota bacterium]MCW8137065.1 hypothetical protein [Planctomycetota bacterium]